MSIDGAYRNLFTELAAKRTDVERDVRMHLKTFTFPGLKDASSEQVKPLEDETFEKIKEYLKGREYDEFMVRWEIGLWISREYIKQFGGLHIGPPPEGF